LLACKKVNPLSKVKNVSVVVDIRSTSNASCPTSAIAQFVKQQRWQMLKLLEGLGKTANINAVCSSDSL
jgi:predicted transcriptional regulator